MAIHVHNGLFFVIQLLILVPLVNFPIGVRLLSNRTSAGESDGFVTLTLLTSFPPNDSFTLQVFTMQRNGTTADSMYEQIHVHVQLMATFLFTYEYYR